ncbi:D-Ala-D-Ala carboxypeptidase family metallohydrolase [Alteromonas sp. BMJM2]|uniref:D-Ala-D-Ala carboxypeptidase family metallohydrolase n=1 Tax=Alteromonas sp. BMJM2 TaxID=2954241 RepID=UPI0022B50652|nr:D-Ala-D-Ala carboxypeptidase family metallohydrolase [Alteromonas sp. BMJM2]
MNSIAKHFLRSEFACKCGCGFDTVDVELLDILKWLRDYFGEPITITSGCRCVAHNAAEGGADQSFHLFGKAADIKVRNVSAREVYEALVENYTYQFGFIEYSSWVHVDSRAFAYHEEL